MAKQITQQTFDEVVRENMSEFDMDADEAVDDAVKQFESQGVNLSIIVKDPKLYASGDDGGPQVHPVIEAIQDLTSSLESSEATKTQFCDYLAMIQKECDIDLARRCLAGSNGAYPALLKVMISHQEDPNMICNALASFCSLTNGQPDLLTSEGIELLISLLKRYKDNPDSLVLIVRAIRLNCVKHESNRQAFISLDLIILLTDGLKEHKSKPSLIKEICTCLRALTLDDDIRVPFGKAHDNAKTIVTEGDALKAILQLCEEHENNISVLAEMFLTLAALVVRNEFCKETMDRGGVKLIMKAFNGGVKDKGIVRQALIVLKALAGNDEVKVEIAKLGGIELIVLALTTHQTNAQIAEAACRVLTAVTLRNTDNSKCVMDCYGHQHIVQAMKLHPNEVNVQKYACMALRNLVTRNKENSPSILSLGAESLINEALAHHKGVEDEAKAVLRDLGCKVEFKELWKGTGATLEAE
ncbi:Armadillo repeat-containing protein 6 [Plakobranchus ocellatus]|uniref:Armadillo repeat-containing protein 6 n=1 Tax=Plakobranchus ocellatus TaxID=259542 RepID=A0AAV4B6F3_9GAST|nr:Armadillo repeat-containing protein 6 [Plakobranchus ocellatus]